MEVVTRPDASEWDRLIKRPVTDLLEISQQVLPVLTAVRKHGDESLRQYTQRFDGVQLKDLVVSNDELLQASDLLDTELKRAIHQAYQNIQRFHEPQLHDETALETTSGVQCWRKAVAIEQVGLYIPGGSAPLLSTVLMLAIPARIAGCREVVLCTPPQADGSIHPAILFAAQLCGVSKIIKVGGAQAIAAMAYGTDSVPQVSKIFGPGNQYVTAAKQLVMQDGLAIDMPAGPSEVLVIADQHADPVFIAADLIAQAEHGPDSQVILVTDSEALAESVQKAIDEQLGILPRAAVTREALSHSRIIITDDLKTAMDFSNRYAPEHLIIQTENYSELAGIVINAGSVFLGRWTPESLGDYASGTNHTLPTNGYAKAYSGVSVDSFIRKITFQEASEEGLKHIGPAVMTMARAEELEGHAQAVSLRIKS